MSVATQFLMPFPSVPFLDMAHPHPGQRGRPFSRRIIASERSGSESVSSCERTSSSSSCIESTIAPISLAFIERKPLVGQPSQTQSPNQTQGWLNKGILHSAGVCLGVLVWRDYFAPTRDGTLVNMSNRANHFKRMGKPSNDKQILKELKRYIPA